MSGFASTGDLGEKHQMMLHDGARRPARPRWKRRCEKQRILPAACLPSYARAWRAGKVFVGPSEVCRFDLLSGFGHAFPAFANLPQARAEALDDPVRGLAAIQEARDPDPETV